MPTRKQLHRIWEMQNEFGIGRDNDDGYNVRGSNMAGIGRKMRRGEFTGEHIGYWVINPETGMPEIVLKDEWDWSKNDRPMDDDIFD